MKIIIADDLDGWIDPTPSIQEDGKNINCDFVLFFILTDGVFTIVDDLCAEVSSQVWVALAGAAPQVDVLRGYSAADTERHSDR